jgi:hypothetical protein
MTRDDEIRRLLIRHYHALVLAQELALKVLDLAQGDTPETRDVMREGRGFAADALARIESGQAHLSESWTTLGVDRRVASTSVPDDRRKVRPTRT